MELSGKMATWLELAVAPDWHRRRSTIKLHPVAGREGRCFVLSMDNRWLCVASGQLTVFRGEEAARRFLQLVHLQAVIPLLITKLYVACWPVKCDLAASRSEEDPRPEELRAMGHVTWAEYECMAQYRERYGQLPEFNRTRKNQSPKYWARGTDGILNGKR